jgi:transposase
MTEIDSEVVRRLVIGRKNDGRAVYDPQAKAEVVRACRRPGVSVSRMALQSGVNANLLRRWIMVSLDTGAQFSKAAVRAMPALAGGGHVSGCQVFTALQLSGPKDVPTNSNNAHARRYFHDAVQALPKNSRGPQQVAVRFICPSHNLIMKG